MTFMHFPNVRITPQNKINAEICYENKIYEMHTGERESSKTKIASLLSLRSQQSHNSELMTMANL